MNTSTILLTTTLNNIPGIKELKVMELLLVTALETVLTLIFRLADLAPSFNSFTTHSID